jgi:hypothetical protein
MFYSVGKFTYEECIKLKKQGFPVPLYPCKRRNVCVQYKNRQGRLRCPGRLVDLPEHIDTRLQPNCGWDGFVASNGSNLVTVIVNEPEKFTPQHIIPII